MAITTNDGIAVEKGPMRAEPAGGRPWIRRSISSLDPIAGPLALFAQRRRREGVIALYHRIAPTPSGIYPALHPDEFDKHCVVLKRSFNVIPLSELIERRRQDEPLEGCCSIAFDDGYLDFRDYALPILERHALPAAQFVITDCLETGRAPWNLRFRRLLLCSGDANAYDEGIYARLNRMRLGERDAWLEERESRLGEVDPFYAVPEMLRLSDLPGIERHGVELGSHTVSHCDLGETDAEATREELEVSKRRLEKLGHQALFVAYPNNSFTGVTTEIARAAGYEAGFGAGDRGVRSGDDPFRIPRIDVTDRPARMLRLELAGAVGAARRFRRRIVTRERD
jgi:peptidoglycan/xylan/chitin deacetylase (PgdA/CDA1 family)